MAGFENTQSIAATARFVRARRKKRQKNKFVPYLYHLENKFNILQSNANFRFRSQLPPAFFVVRRQNIICFGGGIIAGYIIL
jgi:hypothetical protein